MVLFLNQPANAGHFALVQFERFGIGVVKTHYAIMAAFALHLSSNTDFPGHWRIVLHPLVSALRF